MDIELSSSQFSTPNEPLVVPTGARVYRRPNPPPSANRYPTLGAQVRVPVQPQTIDSPARNPLPKKHSSDTTPRALPPCPAPLRVGWFHRLAWLLLPTLLAGCLLAAGALWLLVRSDNLQATRRCDDVTRFVGENDSAATEFAAGDSEALLTSASLSTMFQERFDDFGQSQTPTTRLTGANLLASRFYELHTDGEGHVISARMPTRDGNQRFGPTPDEVAALLELSHLERLDLGNTLASAAVPVANRHPHLKRLVLHNQSDDAPLRRLRDGVQVTLVEGK